MKKSIIAILICIFSFVLVGCASVEYQRVTDDTGLIVDKLTIELDEKKLATKMSPEEITILKHDIREDLENYRKAVQQRVLALTLVDPDTDYKNNIKAVVSDWTPINGVSSVFLQIQYTNSGFLNALNGVTESEETDDGAKIVSNLFVSKYIIESDNVFNDMEEVTSGAGKNYFDYYSSMCDGFAMQDLNLVQVFGTTDDRLHSNADYKTTLDGINYHLWEIDSENGGYKSMKLGYYYRTPVGTGWYIIALASSVALVLILLVVWLIKSKNKKKYLVKVDNLDQKDEENGK